MRYLCSRNQIPLLVTALICLTLLYMLGLYNQPERIGVLDGDKAMLEQLRLNHDNILKNVSNLEHELVVMKEKEAKRSGSIQNLEAKLSEQEKQKLKIYKNEVVTVDGRVNELEDSLKTIQHELDELKQQQQKPANDLAQIEKEEPNNSELESSETYTKSNQVLMEDSISHQNNSPGDLSLNETLEYYKQMMNSSSTKPSRIIWQTWMSNKLPEKVEQYWEDIMSKNPDYTRRIFDDKKIEEYVSQHCPGPYSDVFHSINPALGAMKADLWRYCVLYIEGGVYMDIDIGVSDKPLNEWIDQSVVLSMEGNDFKKSYDQCSSIWAAANATFPMQIMVPNQLVQWAMIFPFQHHPILKEVMDIVTQLLTAWDDESGKRWKTKWRVVCLSGPAVFSVAAHNAYMAAGGEWKDIFAFLDGIDYDEKLSFKSPAEVNEALYRASVKQHYIGVSDETPIKIKEENAQ